VWLSTVVARTRKFARNAAHEVFIWGGGAILRHCMGLHRCRVLRQPVMPLCPHPPSLGRGALCVHAVGLYMSPAARVSNRVVMSCCPHQSTGSP
jgi:hypothetical protein